MNMQTRPKALVRPIKPSDKINKTRNIMNLAKLCLPTQLLIQVQ
jgi:hypothetical protein